MAAWGKADKEWDPDSYGRHAIEPHGQDQHREVLDLMVDCTRDCLEWLLRNQSAEATYWCDLIAKSGVPILRRIAVNAMILRQDIPAEDKILRLLTQFGLQSLPLHHEMFQAMKAVYPLADEEHRQMVIDAVLAGTENANKEAIENDQYHKFSWIEWLLSAAPDSAVTKAALDLLKNAHPGFRQREHPDLLSWSSPGGFVSPETPYSVEQILAKTPSALIPELLAFAGRPHYARLDRDALLAVISSATRANVLWGMELAECLSALGNWTADLWDALIEGWSNCEATESLSKPLLWMERSEVITHHVDALSRALWALAKDEKREGIASYLPRLTDLAISLWSGLQPSTEVPGLRDGSNSPSIVLRGKSRSFGSRSFPCKEATRPQTNWTANTYTHSTLSCKKDRQTDGSQGPS